MDFEVGKSIVVGNKMLKTNTDCSLKKLKKDCRQFLPSKGQIARSWEIAMVKVSILGSFS